MASDNIFKTDVLVVGGGIAACFSALKAKENGADVILVDKGYAGGSGQSPFAGGFAVFDPDKDTDMDSWVDQITRNGEYVNNRAFTKMAFEDSYARYQDLLSWGIEPREVGGSGGPPGRPALLIKTVHLGAKTWASHMRKAVKKSGVRIMDRIMITDLLKQDDRIVGAMGIPMEKYENYIFMAKATILCTGAAAFKPPGWPVHNLTADGDAMAYRVGAEITGKEFADTHPTGAENPGYMNFAKRMSGGPLRGTLLNSEGEEVRTRMGTLFLDMEFEAHAGKAPLTMDLPEGKVERLGGGSSGMSVHKAEGIWPAGTDCSTSIPGLFAAGDALGTMQMGAVYSSPGNALCGSAVTGARAGITASEFSKQAEKPDMDQEELKRIKALVREPAERKGGFSPRWVTQILQNLMIPYYIMYIKKQDRMEAALTLVEFMRDHLAPKLTAKDPHDLRLALETKNMILNAEMRLKSSIFRTESRGCHYREDYPGRDDKNWLAWVLLKQENGKMNAFKKNIPDDYRLDSELSYKERYPYRIPGEKV
jgi:succinate dehydrogenase/fumarate reductase flavoprotein subunit